MHSTWPLWRLRPVNEGTLFNVSLDEAVISARDKDAACVVV